MIYKNYEIYGLIEESGNDPFWSLAARQVFSGVCFDLSKGNNPSIKSLYEVLMTTTSAEFAKLLEEKNPESEIPSDNDKVAKSVRYVLKVYINSLKLLKEYSNNSFSIKEWIRDENQRGFLFLTSRSDFHESIKPLLSLWLDLTVRNLLSLDQETKRKVWFIIDELPSLQKLEALKSGLAESRQFGGSFVISVQLISQLRDIYGRNGAQSISGLTKNKLIFSTPDNETARFCSDDLGNKEVLSNKENISYGAHEVRDGVSMYEQKELQKLVLPSEIMALPNLEFFIKLSNGLPIAKSNVLFNHREDVAKKLIEARNYENQKNIDDLEYEKKLAIQDQHNTENKKTTIISEKQTQENIILDLIESESSKGNLYIPNQFAERFEDQKGLKSKSLVLERISSLSTSGKILYSRDWGYYGLEKISTKLGLMLISGMKYKDKNDQETETRATHFKHPATGVLTAIIDQEGEEDFIDEEEGDEDIEIIDDVNDSRAEEESKSFKLYDDIED